MSISRASVLAGHVLGNTVQAILAVALVLGVGLLLGFRPSASPADWLSVAALIVAVSFAISWIGVAMGMQSKSVETASNLPMILTILPLLGSGFVPTDSMPGWLQGFADYQPFTAFIEAVRSLLIGTPMGWNLALAVGWCAVIAMAGYAWSMAIYERKSVRS